jgi:hypothetical protein
LLFLSSVLKADSARPWIPLFDGKSLEGWRASEHIASWKVRDGCLVAEGQRSHLFYVGPVGDNSLRNFELKAEVKTQGLADSGILFHTRFQEVGFPTKGHELQINNRRGDGDPYRPLQRTGSLLGVRNVYKSCVKDGVWSSLRLRVIGHRIGVWVNGHPTVDYLEPEQPHRESERSTRLLSSGTIALQCHGPDSRVIYRRVAIRLLPDGADPGAWKRAPAQGYGLKDHQMDRLASFNMPVIDFHVHLRGGMTVDKAIDRQAVTGINVGVLRNLGKGWPLETDAQLKEFLDHVDGKPVFVGLQVNDRDWHTKHSLELLKRLDFVLADTMIMPMPDDDSPPVKLFEPDQLTIDNAEAWMERYVKHNLRVLAEPITILANPTWLPPIVEDQYDQLWTDQRMRQVIQAAVTNRVALEINAGSGYPRERFVRMAKRMGAKFSFGSNNFNDRPIDMSRCLEAIEKYDLSPNDMYVPEPISNRQKRHRDRRE